MVNSGIITIPKSVTGREELVVLPRREFERMKAQMIPTVFLRGKAAGRLDRRVREGLREYKKGKTMPLEEFLKKKYPHLLRFYAR